MNKKTLINDKNVKSKYIIRLQENDNPPSTYRVGKELFNAVKKEVSPYLSLQSMPKKIQCIETGKIFCSAKEAVNWLYELNLTDSYSADTSIKAVCNGKRATAYGYHWKFVEE